MCTQFSLPRYLKKQYLWPHKCYGKKKGFFFKYSRLASQLTTRVFSETLYSVYPNCILIWFSFLNFQSQLTSTIYIYIYLFIFKRFHCKKNHIFLWRHEIYRLIIILKKCYTLCMDVDHSSNRLKKTVNILFLYM